MVEALVAKGNPALKEREAAVEAKSRAQFTAEAFLTVLEARHVTVSEAQRQEILACPDLDQLTGGCAGRVWPLRPVKS